MRLGNYNQAKFYLDKALNREIPTLAGQKGGVYVEAYLNRGLLEYMVENDSDAITIYREALSEVFDFDLVWNYGYARLRQYCSNKYNDLAYCWQLYETRYRINNSVGGGLVNWTGGVHVDSITVRAEQGIGDNIMFARYLPEVAKFCNRLVVECTPETSGLFDGYEKSYGKDTTTHYISIGSLGNLLDHIPSTYKIPYSKPNNGKIGINWSSSNKHANGANRNIPYQKLVCLKQYADVYSINPEHKGNRAFKHLASTNWADTINNIRQLDLVITIDSSIAHLCGAMGVDCLVLMPLRNSDFRWGDKSMGTTNLWYESVKVIRNDENWDTVIKDVVEYVRSK